MYKRLNSTTTLIHRITTEAPHEHYVLHWPAVTDGSLDQAEARHLASISNAQVSRCWVHPGNSPKSLDPVCLKRVLLQRTHELGRSPSSAVRQWSPG